MENGSSAPGRKIMGLSGRLPAISHRKEQEFGQKTTEQSIDFPTWNTASMKSSEFLGTDSFLAVLSHLGITYIQHHYFTISRQNGQKAMTKQYDYRVPAQSIKNLINSLSSVGLGVLDDFITFKPHLHLLNLAVLFCIFNLKNISKLSQI